MLPAWNLTDLYQNQQDPQIKLDQENLDNAAKEFAQKYTNKISKLSGKQLADTIAKYENIYTGIGKLATFSYLYFVTEMTNQVKSSFYQNMAETLNNISTNLLFFPLEINAITDKKLNDLYRESADLAKFKPFIRDIRLSKKYQKTAEIEKILHEKNQTANTAWSRLFDETIAGLEFKFGTKKHTAAEIFNLLSDNDGLVRKKAAKAIGQTLAKNIKLLAYITNILAKDKAIEDHIRSYAHPVQARNVSNLIEDEVVEALVSTVKANYHNFSHRYYKLKAHIFGQKTLDYWDRNAPLPNYSEQNISYKKAQEIVLTAYRAFSPKMADIVQLFFTHNWIDVPPRKGKDSGAFAHPATPDIHPYIMLNYQGKLRDVMTLAHELGHGVHQYLAAKQGYLMSDTPLTLAETASIFGEQLTFESLLKNCHTKQEKISLLVSKIEDSINTIIRQIAFYSFEFAVHKARKSGELTIEQLNKIWLNVQKESLGPAIKLHAEYKYYWSYIPHFIHSPFYVYAYSFGNLLVNSLYGAYKNGIENFEQKYLTALTAGGTLPHKELLQPFNLDASDPNFWQQGLNLPLSYIDELEKLVA
ncbi:MAG: M3 family oligoendopeptidase [Rickettsiales bacterium]